MQENGVFENGSEYTEPGNNKPNTLGLFGEYPVTMGLIAINVVVFLAMCISGVSIFEPTGLDIIHWGGNMRAYTLAGDWWRLITNVFEHIGLIHIALNMFALFQLGLFLEKLVGWKPYLAVYLGTGILASLVSLWWNGDRVSAGASGAIFGLFGFFLALLLTNLIEKSVRQSLLKSIGLVIFLNLVYGMKGNVDNSAHIGGLVSGAIFGFLIYLFIIKHKSIQLFALLVVIISIAVPAAYLFSHQDNTQLFDKALEKMQVDEKQAIDAQNKLDVRKEKESLEIIRTTIFPLWDKAKATIDNTDAMKLNNKQTKFRNSLKYYISLRVANVKIIEDALKGDTTTIKKLPVVKNGIDSVLKELNAQ